jgi:hypothetical protein
MNHPPVQLASAILEGDLTPFLWLRGAEDLLIRAKEELTCCGGLSEAVKLADNETKQAKKLLGMSELAKVQAEAAIKHLGLMELAALEEWQKSSESCLLENQMADREQAIFGRERHLSKCIELEGSFTEKHSDSEGIIGDLRRFFGKSGDVIEENEQPDSYVQKAKDRLADEGRILDDLINFRKTQIKNYTEQDKRYKSAKEMLEMTEQFMLTTKNALNGSLTTAQLAVNNAAMVLQHRPPGPAFMELMKIIDEAASGWLYKNDLPGAGLGVMASLEATNKTQANGGAGS